MSKKYKFSDNSKLYFVSFSVTNWIDLFIRNEYKEILLDSIRYCQREKEMELYGWCIMTSHVHLVIGTKGNPLSNIMRDLKRHTSEELHKAIKNNRTESRREWMLFLPAWVFPMFLLSERPHLFLLLAPDGVPNSSASQLSTP